MLYRACTLIYHACLSILNPGGVPAIYNATKWKDLLLFSTGTTDSQPPLQPHTTPYNHGQPHTPPLIPPVSQSEQKKSQCHIVLYRVLPFSASLQDPPSQPPANS